jgi:hypothetical protein
MWAEGVDVTCKVIDWMVEDQTIDKGNRVLPGCQAGTEMYRENREYISTGG